MPSWCRSLHVIRNRIEKIARSDISRLAAVAINGQKQETLAMAFDRIDRRRASIGGLSKLFLREPALAGPAVPYPLEFLEIERRGTFEIVDELHSVHMLEQAWVPPMHALLQASARFPELAFEMTYIEDGQDFCGAALARSGEMLALYDAPLSPIEQEKNLLSVSELNAKPFYLSSIRWFLQIQAYRMAGLRQGEVIRFPDPIIEPQPNCLCEDSF